MRSVELTLAYAALMIVPIVGIFRILSWDQGAYASQRSRLQLASVVPARHVDEPYASSRDCESCHPGEYRSWHQSYHRTMTQLATPEAVVADFDDVELSRIVPARRPGTKPRIERYRLSRRDDQFWVALEGPDRRMPPRESRVVMTTGSHHQQVVWVWGGRGREIFHLPFTYLIDEGRWIERNQAFLAPPEDPFGEVLWNDICIECHSTGGQPRISQSGAPSNPRVVEFGICCESCHGPGRDHVEANRSPWHRFWNRNLEDPTITNPKRLSARRASHVCGRCHSITSHAVNDVWEGHWNAFEPGDDLEADGRVVMHPESKDPAHQKVIAEHARVEAGRFPRDRFWSDGAVRVAGRELNDVVTSPCFEGGEFSCLSCHAMHDYESVVDQLDY